MFTLRTQAGALVGTYAFEHTALMDAVMGLAPGDHWTLADTRKGTLQDLYFTAEGDIALSTPQLKHYA